MKEHTEQNEAFVVLHETMTAEGKTREAIITACIETFKLGGSNPRHTYRAYVARLADPKKYKGVYSERMKKFQRQPATKTANDASVKADMVVTQENAVEVGG